MLLAAPTVPNPARRTPGCLGGQVGEEVKVYLQMAEGVTRDQMTPERFLEAARAELAPFKLPRYVAYVEAFPKTESDRVEKKKLTAGVGDLRAGAFDRIGGVWR